MGFTFISIKQFRRTSLYAYSLLGSTTGFTLSTPSWEQEAANTPSSLHRRPWTSPLLPPAWHSKYIYGSASIQWHANSIGSRSMCCVPRRVHVAWCSPLQICNKRLVSGLVVSCDFSILSEQHSCVCQEDTTVLQLCWSCWNYYTKKIRSLHFSHYRRK